jgi:hypothetical protein
MKSQKPVPHSWSQVVLAVAFMVIGAAASTAQYRVEKVPDCGIQFSAPNRLERLPMQLGTNAVYQRARLRPKDTQDYVRARYYWYCDVYSFAKKEQKASDIKLPEGVPESMREQFKELMAGMGRGERHKSFEDWLNAKEGIEVIQKGKLKKKKGKKLAYKHWVYLEDNGFGPVGQVYCEAAVYEFEDREVALVIEMPLESKRPPKPKSKWYNIIKKVMRSGEACKAVAANASSDKRDKYADTPDRKKALEDAKANIAGLNGWDYFTLPNYIVFYSWDFEKPSEKAKSRKKALFYSERLEKMRELYIESYPLDPSGTKAIMPDPDSIPGLTGPITGKDDSKGKAAAAERLAEKSKELGKKPYSVFRLCATEEQFQKYGQSPPGVVGWYSPRSKELVVFLGGDRRMGAGATETVTYHEGWHQFADFYFHPPESEKHATLHRWFDEGHGDYFGGFRWGSRGWSYKGSKMRYSACKQMVRQEDYAPFKDIVRWDRRRFYGKNAPYYYAQAFSMIDFFRRGHKSKGWQEKWGEIPEMYRRVILVKGDAKLAVDVAFRDFTDEDWAELEEAWKAWVGSRKFLKG